MTDLEARLRSLSRALTSDVPDVPPLDALPSSAGGPRPHRRRRPVLVGLAAALAFVLMGVAVGLLIRDRVAEPPAQPVPDEACRPDPGPHVGVDGQTFGPLVQPAASDGDATPGWPVNLEAVPDFVRVACEQGDGIIGWVRSSDLIPQLVGDSIADVASGNAAGTEMCDEGGSSVGRLRTSPRYPVFADDGETVIGHIYPPIGFVALGDEPRPYPDGNGLRPCNGDETVLTIQPASSRAELARPGAVNHAVVYDGIAFWNSDPSATTPFAGVGDDGGPIRYTTWVERALANEAISARAGGRPYNPADLLVPLRDEAGRIVGYSAANLSQMLTRAEVADPDFDLCRLQVADMREQQERLRADPPKSIPSEARQDVLYGDPGASIGC